MGTLSFNSLREETHIERMDDISCASVYSVGMESELKRVKEKALEVGLKKFYERSQPKCIRTSTDC